ncbi:MAG: IS200/IS605 family element transposase accessory protein TnpB [Candidatus Diapherotrites archaeon]|uniref:IS200/IS605 family element transposase accessory protein TnpB n=1 Tax=Candidatus Iainarchaeum sp. TaxID=3101447 RepID=A0A8T3YM75_9ARCH|nr:IS200/IS605 family element transposase accessory protein TnpB [Candidatus Diapherotrites archaeon]
MLSYVFRLYPNRVQALGLGRSLELCRQAYNFLLEKLNQQSLSGKNDVGVVKHSIVELKNARPEFNEVYSKALQPECDRLFSNLRSLRQLKKNGKKVGALRFKGKDWFKTFSYNQSGFRIEMVKSKKGILHLSKIGSIKIKVHRPVEGRIKQVTLKNRLGKWFAILITDANPKRVHGEKVLGIDLGINNYLVDSDGNRVAHPHNIDKHAQRLALAQRDLARKNKGSGNRKKARLAVAKVHEKIERCRNDFLHKLSAKYVKGCRTIVVEDLDIVGMARSARNARNIMDSSWARFLQMLAYKAASAGCELAKVNPRNTTKTCSKCGNLREMPLWQRIYSCGNCGVAMDRDYNSAMNILHRFLGRVPALARESPSTLVGQGGSMKQETTFVERLAVSSDASPFRGW